MVAHCTIELLGGLRVQLDGRVITRFQTQKTRTLLAYLAFYQQRNHLREELVDWLWPEDDPDVSRHKLRMALSSLRRQLEPPGVPSGSVIIADRNSVQLNAAAVQIDVAEFESRLQAALRTASCLERVHHQSEAVEFYRGELLPTLYEDWILPERQRLAEAHQAALGQLVAHWDAVGDLPRAIEYARRAIAADSLREEAHETLIRLLAKAGQIEAALRQYLELERVLDEELDEEPSAGTRQFVEQLRRAGGPAFRAEPCPAGLEERGRRPAGAPRAIRISRGSPQPSSLVAVFPDPAAAPSAAGRLAPIPLPTGIAAAPFLPAGTVTFLVTHLPSPQELPEPVRPALAQAEYQEWLRPLFRGHGGSELLAAGETVHFVFGRASEALTAAVAAREVFSNPPWPAEVSGPAVRMALHTGEVEPGDEVHGSPALQHATGLLMAANPGQILLSEKSAALLKGEIKDDLRLVDLGRYRVRDQAPPEHLFLIEVAEGTPPHRARVRARRLYVSSLPQRFNRFIGRQRQIARLQEQLQAKETRLVTLTGAGGAGKTALALEVATRLAELFEGTLWFVPLADLGDAHLIPEAILDAMQLPPSPDQAPLEQVVEVLAGQPALLILDNFEHLAGGGTPLVQTLLARVPSLKVLVTSRQRLALPDEQTVPVRPLPIPEEPFTPERLLRNDSVRLFVERAQAVRADFQVTGSNAPFVARLCQRLEGIPLALELAAARVGVLTPSQILSRLDQRFELLVSRGRERVSRHQSLRSALDWSFRLLSPDQQQLFARLSIFRGGWSMEAAAGVCASPGGSDDAVLLEAMSQLQECWLVLADEQDDEMRYRMLETIQEYAADQVPREDQEELARRHVQYFVRMAEQAEPHLTGPQQRLWLEKLETEHANLRAALRWCEGGEEADLGLRCAGALWRFWYVRGHWSVGRARLEGLLVLPGDVRSPARAKALRGAGVLAHRQGDLTAARKRLEEGLAIARECGDPPTAVGCLAGLGFVAREQGDLPRARDLFQESLALCREAGDAWGAALALAGLGDLSLGQGDHATARARYLESLSIRRKLGDQRFIAVCLNNLADLARAGGEWKAAQALYAESLAIMRALGNKGGIAGSRAGMANVALHTGQLGPARLHFAESLATRRELGDRRGMAECLEGLAAVAGGQGDIDGAARLFGAAAALREDIHSPAPGVDRDQDAGRHDETSHVEEFLARWSDGQQMSLEQAIGYALELPIAA
jgi:predicted ATPase/DNA-binding SARP family transcriptional activator